MATENYYEQLTDAQVFGMLMRAVVDAATFVTGHATVFALRMLVDEYCRRIERHCKLNGLIVKEGAACIPKLFRTPEQAFAYCDFHKLKTPVELEHFAPLFGESVGGMAFDLALLDEYRYVEKEDAPRCVVAFTEGTSMAPRDGEWWQ